MVFLVMEDVVRKENQVRILDAEKAYRLAGYRKTGRQPLTVKRLLSRIVRS